MKLRLSIELLGDKTLKMSIHYICSEALKTEGDSFKTTHIDVVNDITVWSCGDFLFDHRQIRLPELGKYTTGNKYEFQFKSEEERYNVLKKYYKSLNKWALDTRIFPNTDESIKDRIYFINNVWVVI